MSYLFEPGARRAFLIEVAQDGLDFSVQLQAPDGTTQTYNSPLRRDEREWALVEDSVPGIYSITVSSVEPTNATGTFELRLVGDVGGSPSLAAIRLMSEGAKAAASASREGAETALDSYRRAAGAWQELGRAREQAQALYSAAMLEYWVMYQWDAAAELAASAAEIYAMLSLPELHANALALQAACLSEQGNEAERGTAKSTFDAALALFERSRAIHEGLGNRYQLGHVINNIGATNYYMGNYELAAAAWNEAAPLFRSAGEWRDEFLVLQNLAAIDLNNGRNSKAIGTFEYILDNLPDDKDAEFRAIVLDSLGGAYREAGRVDDALRTFSAALDIHKTIDDRTGEASSLRGLGSTYYAFGELDLARQYLEQALVLAKESNDGRRQAGILTSLGNIAYANADYRTALEAHRAALETTFAPADQAYRRVLIARDLSALGEHESAMRSAVDARSVVEKNDGSRLTLADALNEIGGASLGMGHHAEAATSFSAALAHYEALGLAGAQADALAGLAASAKATGDMMAAAEYGRRALQHVEDLRERVAAPELRASYAATRRRYYEAQIELLMAMEGGGASAGHAYLREALTTSERARSRMTVDLVSEASAGLRRGTDQQLLTRQQALYAELAATAFQRDQLVSSGASSSRGGDLEVLLSRMSAIVNDLNVLETEVRRSSPRYASFASPDTLSADEIRRLVGPDTVLLQYSLGQPRSFVWAVTPDGIAGIEIADQATIEAAATLAFEGLERYTPDALARRRLDENLLELSRLVLEPVADFLDVDRVLIAAEGALQYIPFAVLPVASDAGAQPLVTGREVIGIPSMSVLAGLRARDKPALAPKTIAVFADPVLDATDSRLGQDAVKLASLEPKPELITRSSVGGNLGRLPATAEEARVIGELVPEGARLVASGFDASRSRLLEDDLSQYRVVHLATHGLIDSRYPALSALVLSRFDAQGRAQDGFVRLPDVYNLELNADLVVLSACDTALGRQIRGEGLIGLTQGFLYAGARSLLVSLWQVDDRATAELMRRFYEAMFRGGLRPAAALRQAQTSIAAERRWSDPYFWGAFVLLGDWE